MNKTHLTMLALASVGISASALAASPFETAELPSGYAVAMAGDKAGEHACGEGACGGKMSEEKKEEKTDAHADHTSHEGEKHSDDKSK